jgi:hypothetical protein
LFTIFRNDRKSFAIPPICSASGVFGPSSCPRAVIKSPRETIIATEAAKLEKEIFVIVIFSL